MAAVFAQLMVGGESCGVHCFLVPLRDAEGRVLPGIRIEDDGDKAGLNGVDNGMIWFSSVRVGRDALLNRYGDVSAEGSYTSPIENPNKRFFTMLGTLVQGRVCIAAASVSASKNALSIAVRYGLKRRQFGPEDARHEVTLMSYRTHQRRLMPLLARTFALSFGMAELIDRFHRVFSSESKSVDDAERRELETLAAGMKAICSWHAMEAIQTGRECCGGAGYMRAAGFAALREDVDIFTTFEGDNTVLLLLCARGVLTGYAQDFGGLNPAALVTFVAGQAVETVVERLFARKIVQVLGDALPGGSSEEGDLFDREHQLDLFRWRQGHIVASVAGRFRRGLSEGYDPFEVFRAVQNHAADAARAWLAVFVLESFADAVDACGDEAVRRALSSVCDLYALSEIERDKGFFQEHGRLAAVRTEQITREVNALCNSVASMSLELVEGFGIPPEALASSIAFA